MHKVARRLAKTFSKEYFCPKVRVFCPHMYLNKICEFFLPNLRLDCNICYALQIFITLYWKVDSIKVIGWTSSNIPCIPRCVIFIEIVILTNIPIFDLVICHSVIKIGHLIKSTKVRVFKDYDIKHCLSTNFIFEIG